MWILLKLFVALMAPLVRIYARKIRAYSFIRNKRVIEGIGLLVQNGRKDKSTVFSIEADYPAVFKLTRESRWNRFFKALGLAKKIETGDHAFDQQIYIASDNEQLCNLLSSSALVREMAIELFEREALYIQCDKEVLSFGFSGDVSYDEELQKACINFYREVCVNHKTLPGLFSDPFARKVLIIESFVWSIAAFAQFSWDEILFVRDGGLLYGQPVVVQGLAVGLLGAILLFAVIRFFLSGSSRGHRILIESFILLFMSLPVAGIGIVVDANTRLDKSESVVIRARIADLESVKHKGGRGSTWYTYHMLIVPFDHVDGINVPSQVQIDYRTFAQARQGQVVELKIGRGLLNHPWYRAITLK